jgi:hypothetical protein
MFNPRGIGVGVDVPPGATVGVGVGVRVGVLVGVGVAVRVGVLVGVGVLAAGAACARLHRFRSQ